MSARIDGAFPLGSAGTTTRAISADGRYVVFSSWDRGLVANDDYYYENVFLRDRMTGVTSRASVTNDGSQPDGLSEGAAISADGRHVVFMSGSTNLVADDTNNSWDVFVRDQNAGRTVRVSIATDGTQTDADSMWPTISADGRFVTFTTSATTLGVGSDPYQPVQAYVHDRDSDGNGVFDEANGTSTSVVSVSTAGDVADADARRMVINGDGRFVAFESTATNLDPAGNPNQYNHVYLRDRQTGETTLIDRAVTGAPSEWGADYWVVEVSLDGRFVTYTSPSNDIVPLPFTWQSQVYRYDRETAQTVLVSALPDGTPADSSNYQTSVSADGRYVAFTTRASNLAGPPSLSGHYGVLVRDMVDGTFTRVDVVDGVAFDHWYPYYPALSADGTAIAFNSDASNAVGQYSINKYHAFVATGFSAAPTSASYLAEGGSGTIEVNTTAVSGWAAAAISPYDEWITVTDGGGFGAGPRTVQYSVAPNTTGIARDGSIRLGSSIVTIHQDSDGDTTPPVVTPVVTGVLGGDGWYIGNVTVQWSVEDPDSPVTIDSGCTTVTVATDGISQSACRATSHGGTTLDSVSIPRDTTAPAISILTPAPSTYVAGSAVAASFTCSDGDGSSGVATCTSSDGAMLDPTPGWHTFTATARDRAGNGTSKTVQYLVGTGMCVVPNDSLKAWWRFDGDTYDAFGNLWATPVPYSTQYYDPGLAGQSWRGQATSYLDASDGSWLFASNGLTVAAWVRPGSSGQPATIVSKPNQYRVARFPDGTLRWAFSQTTGFDWVNTGVVIPDSVAWTHVAVSYDAGLVKTYVNGWLVHTQQLSGTLTPGNPAASITIGGRPDAYEPWWGSLDELQVFTAALPASDIEAIALAGNGGVCVPKSTSLTISVPASVGFGPTFPVTATLRDSDGNPVAANGCPSGPTFRRTASRRVATPASRRTPRGRCSMRPRSHRTPRLAPIPTASAHSGTATRTTRRRMPRPVSPSSRERPPSRGAHRLQLRTARRLAPPS
ncbi:MAG TPA: LamG-like jellyroll fold domain-containing protein [Vicinamibacterales bacterium]